MMFKDRQINKDESEELNFVVHYISITFLVSCLNNKNFATLGEVNIFKMASKMAAINLQSQISQVPCSVILNIIISPRVTTIFQT